MVYPLEFVRTRMATRTYDHTKASTMVTNLVKKDGLRTVYNGLLPNVAGVLLYKGFGFYTFENLKVLQQSLHMPKFLDSFIAASIAGLAGQILSYPAEIVKRKYMVVAQKDKVWVKQLDREDDREDLRTGGHDWVL